MSHAQQIVGCFALFLLSISLYGWLYYGIFRRWPNSFLFGAEIRPGQREAFVEESVKAISWLDGALQAFSYWEEQFAPGVNAFKTCAGPETMPSGLLTTIEPQVTAGPVGVSVMQYFMKVSDAEGQRLGSVAIPLRRQGIEKKWLERQRKRMRIRSALLKEQVAGATTETPYIWSFWDFLYFSSITQTTVGYGDILPNATRVRLLVTSQVVMGYAILTVLLNVVLSGN